MFDFHFSLYFKKKYYCHLKFLIKYKGEILKEKKKESELNISINVKNDSSLGYESVK